MLQTEKIEKKREMKKYSSPVTIFLSIALLIFAGHSIIKLILPLMGESIPTLTGAVLDSIFLIFIVSPALYFFLYRPLNNEALRGAQLEKALRKNRDQLKRRVEKRTIDLVKTNQQLLDKITEKKQTELLLQKQKDEAKKYLDIVGVIIIVINSDQRVSLVNKKGCEVLGCTEEELLDLNWFDDFVPPNEREKLKNDHFKIMTGENQLFEYHESSIISKNGERKLIAWRNTLLKDDHGNIIGTMSSGQDITYKREMENLLKNSKEEWSNTFNDIDDMITVHDKDHNIVLANKAAEKFLGMPLSKILKEKCFKCYHGSEKPIEGCSSCQVMESGRQCYFEMFEPHQNKYIAIKIFPRFDSFGKVNGNIHVVRDITKRKQAEEKLKQSERQYRDIVDNALVGIFKSDSKGNIFFMNEEFAKIFEYSSVDEAKKDPDHYFKTNPYVKGELLKILKKTGIIKNHKLKILTKKGQQKHLLCNITLEEDILSGMVLDITEHQSAQIKIEKQMNRLNALRTIDKAIIGSLDYNHILDTLINEVISKLEVDAASVLLLNKDTLFLSYAASKGFKTNRINKVQLKYGESYAGVVVKNRKNLFINNLSKFNGNISEESEYRFSKSLLIEEERFKSYFAVPLIVKGTIKGVLEVFHRTTMEPDPDWVYFLETLAGQASIAIDNSFLFQDLQKSKDELIVAYDTTIEGWSKALDFRDKETEGHSLRVTDLTVAIARSMGVIDEELVHIRRGALLHDIGKLGIPDSILLKPCELNDAEWAVMREHPKIAYEILSPIDFLRHAIDIPYCHHEKWDGSGYPRGLKGHEIPFSARIFSIVDVYDALRSDRPYRKAWSLDKTKEHIQFHTGSHFDPQITEAFFKEMEQLGGRYEENIKIQKQA